MLWAAVLSLLTLSSLYFFHTMWSNSYRVHFSRRSLSLPFLSWVDSPSPFSRLSPPPAIWWCNFWSQASPAFLLTFTNPFSSSIHLMSITFSFTLLSVALKQTYGTMTDRSFICQWKTCQSFIPFSEHSIKHCSELCELQPLDAKAFFLLMAPNKI